MAIKQRRMTLEEFLKLPEEKPALEFEDGVVTQKVPPQGQHAVLQVFITGMINQVVVQGRIALALSELRTTYDRYSRVPDIAVYTWGRIPRESSGRVANDFREPPDIAIEIVSPGQSLSQLVDKCTWYVQHGVKAAVIVEPDSERLRLLRRGRNTVVLDRGEMLDLRDIVAGLSFAVDEIFDTLYLGA